MKPEYAGMTLNERLFAIGKLEAFTIAAKAHDAEAMEQLLRLVETKPGEAAVAVQAILADPLKYGF